MSAKIVVRVLPRGSSLRHSWTFSRRKVLFSEHIPYTQQRLAHNPADSPDFLSIVDNPPVLVKSGRRHGYGLIALGRLPIGSASIWILC